MSSPINSTCWHPWQAYSNAHPLVVERPIVTVLDDDTGSASFSRTYPSSGTSRTSYASTRSNCPRVTERQRNNNYNLQHSKRGYDSWVPGVFSASGIGNHSQRSSEPLFASPLGHAVGNHDRVLPKERDLQSAAASKSGLFNLVKYPWGNNPIAVAIWLAQKINSIKKSQASQSWMQDLEQDAPTSNFSRRPGCRHSQLPNGVSLNAVSEVHFPRPTKPCQSNNRHNGECQTEIDIERLYGEQRPSLDSFSTQSFGYQMDLEARRIAPSLVRLKSFKPGYGDRLFGIMADDHHIDVDTAAAGKLVVDVLATFTCSELQSQCQAATDALIKELDKETCQSPRFTKIFTILSNDPIVTKAVDFIVAQINSCEFSLGLDGEYDGIRSLSNHHNNPKASHSPQSVNSEQLSIDTRALENDPNRTQCQPPTSFSLFSPHPSGHVLPENIPTDITSVSMIETQSTYIPESVTPSIMPPRQSNRIRKPTLRAIEAKLSSQARPRVKSREPKASKKLESRPTQTEDTIARTSEEYNDVKSGVDVTNREASDTTDNVDLTSPVLAKRPMTARSIDEIAAMARNDAQRRTAAAGQPKRTTISRSIDEIAAAASLNRLMDTGTSGPTLPKQQPKPPKSATLSSSATRALTPETNAMVEQLLDLATAASKPDFQPEIEIDLHRARRDWYAEQLAAALNKAATEKSLETNWAQTSQETIPDGDLLSSQPTPSNANAPWLETSVATLATQTEDFALSITGHADSACAAAKDPDVPAGMAAALASPFTQVDSTAEQTSIEQLTTVEIPVSDKAVEPDVSKWPISSTNQKFLDPSILSHSYLPRPWTDNDGWIHTGLGNDHNEEDVIVPNSYTWVRPRDSFNNPRIAPSPPRLKSLIQIELDDAFGYPPPGRKPNLPQDLEGQFVPEDVAVEKEKAKVFRAARIRGIAIDRSALLEDIRLAIKKHDEIHAANETASGSSDGIETANGKAPAKSSDTSAGTSKRTKASRKRNAGQALGIAAQKEGEDDPHANLGKISRNKKRRLNIDVPIAESSSAALGHGSESGSPADGENVEIDLKPILLAPRGPGRPSRSAAAIAATAATRGVGKARQRRKHTQLQAHPESITSPASQSVTDEPANNSVATKPKDRPAAEKDAVSVPCQGGQD
ncbi:GPI-anchored cell surface glycoprotein [Histoplasma capsulatum var. duboisii H88]|uniref:GPI-anchored cell surface glycoprotein n=1 Tax=Ajellomyces capsulatus (strain H88) TaxID=544711 RepID=A0A8A1LIU9_AJEC8|nr:GPI-anchored cell surface glycoprotein [Histoplasma capsulatum var. duboisii H88]